MEKLDYALVSDGDSDRCLLPVLEWSLRRFIPKLPINGKTVDFSRLPVPPKSLSGRIVKAIDYYRPDLLFIHRDAEAQDARLRYDEIENAIKEINISHPYLCIVPIRMTEAWLLFDEVAIRKAAGNPNSRVEIDLPSINTLESIPNPKNVLFSILEKASELHGRKKKRFRPEKRRFLITEYIIDFSPLLALSAFKRLQEDIKRFCEQITMKR